MSEAERLAREAAAIADRTDYIDFVGDAHRVLGDVLAAADRAEEVADEWRVALDLYERKDNIVRAEQLRERLAR